MHLPISQICDEQCPHILTCACLHLLAWCPFHRRNFPDLLSTNSNTFILTDFQCKTNIPYFQCSWPHISLLILIWHLFKRYHTSEQRCVTYEDYVEPCKPLLDRRVCPEHWKSTRGMLLDVGSLPCVAVDVELQHWGYLGIARTVSDSREPSSRRVLQLEWVNRLSFIFLVCLSTHWWCITHICTQGLFKCMKAIPSESFANTLNIFWVKFCSTFLKEEDRSRVQHACCPVLSTTAAISIQ